jgi:integrase
MDSATSAEGRTLNEWLLVWKKLYGERGLKSAYKRIREAERLVKLFGVHADKPIAQFPVSALAKVLDELTAQGKNGMALVYKTLARDIFKTATSKGFFPESRQNPADLVDKISTKIKRERMSLDLWKTLFEAAGKEQPWLQNAMLLAIVTGQRVGDISRFKFSDVRDDFLWIEQSKTGAKLRIPLALRLNAIGYTLGDVVSRCRDNVLSPYMLHSTNTRDKGKPIKSATITSIFALCRKKTELKWTGGPPSFHEQRSLAARLYAEQGIDAQRLLGHKNAEMTAVYTDTRGAEWLEVKL